MENYRFQLEKTSKKHTCPSCGKRRFVRFIDTQTGQYLPPIYGRCDREANCNYYLTPYADSFAAEVLRQEKENQPAQWQPHPIPAPKPQPPAKPVFIPFEILQATRTRPLSKNTFIQNLATNIPFPFEMPDLKKVADLYQLGTLAKGYFAGAISFPFIDQENRVRAIQIKQFDQHNHTTKTSFIHAILEQHFQEEKKNLPKWLIAYKQQEKKVSCLFGEHLLKSFPNNPVALVEAPKTCIYATLYFGPPDAASNNLIWLGVYNLSSLSFEKIMVLAGRKVVLFPDLSKDGVAFKLWSEKAKAFESKMPDTKFVVSDLLEQNAAQKDREKGLDLADFLIQQDWRNFRQHTHQQDATPPKLQPNKQVPPPESKPLQTDKKHQPATMPTLDTWQPESQKLWDLSELESFFKILKHLPTEPIKISKAGTITNPAKYIQSHLAAVKANNGNRWFEPYLDRLITFKKFIEDEKRRAH